MIRWPLQFFISSNFSFLSIGHSFSETFEKLFGAFFPIVQHRRCYTVALKQARLRDTERERFICSCLSTPVHFKVTRDHHKNCRSFPVWALASAAER